MVKKTHSVYTIENLNEGKPRSNDADEDDLIPTDDFRLGIDTSKHNGKRRFTIDAYDEDDSLEEIIKREVNRVLDEIRKYK